MQSIQSILPKVLGKRGLKVQADASRAVHLAQIWLDGALPLLKGSVSVKKVSHATLSIACSHSIAAQECHALVPMLLEYLRRETSPKLVSDIRLVRG